MENIGHYLQACLAVGYTRCAVSSARCQEGKPRGILPVPLEHTFFNILSTLLWQAWSWSLTDAQTQITCHLCACSITASDVTKSTRKLKVGEDPAAACYYDLYLWPQNTLLSSFPYLPSVYEVIVWPNWRMKSRSRYSKFWGIVLQRWVNQLCHHNLHFLTPSL